MTSTAAFGGLILSFVLSVGAPIALYVVARRRMTIAWRNIACGLAVFCIAVLALEGTLHNLLLRGIPATSAWFHAHKVGYIAYAVLAAGIFEEVGRFIAMRFFVRPTGVPGTATAYGLGHGGGEAIIIGGLAQLQTIAMAVLFNTGKLDEALAGTLPPAALSRVHEQFAHLTFAATIVGGFERLVAFGLQIGLSFIVWHAVRTGKIWLLFAAITMHALSDLGAGLFQTGFISSIWLAELWGLAALVAILACVRALPRLEPG